MFPPIYAALAAYAPLTALIGTAPVRAYPFGEAPQDVARPYIVWRTIGGEPENYLGQRPDMDGFSLQVDIYANTASSARAAALQARDAIEGVAYITAWYGEDRDSETKSYRYSFGVDWLVAR
jgi:hypothetical protein